MTKLTPAQQQYADMKKQHPDCVLLFRLGDFYEVFHEDAQIAHKVLGITLTARDKNAENPIPMAGIPYHALERYLPKLIAAGYKVAIADQVGEVVPGKLVERQITQIITPGTWIEDGAAVSYVCGIAQYADYRVMCWGDTTLGERKVKRLPHRDDCVAQLERIIPRELVLASSVHDGLFREKLMHDISTGCVSYIPAPSHPTSWLESVLGVKTLQGFGDALHREYYDAVIALFSYLVECKQLPLIRSIVLEQNADKVYFDALTMRNLEIFQGSYQGNKKQSLFGILDVCCTSMGSRLLAERLSSPTQNIEFLNKQFGLLEKRNTSLKNLEEIRGSFKEYGDLPRLIQRITQKKRFIQSIQGLTKQILFIHQNVLIDEILGEYCNINVLSDSIQQCHELSSWICEDATEEDWVADGKDAEIDRCRSIAHHVDDILLSYQQSLIQHFEVAVKVKHITNQGYMLEVTPKDIQKFESRIVPGDEQLGMIRSQTLKTGQRYTSSYLQSVQQQIYDAEIHLIEANKQCFNHVYALWQQNTVLFYQYANAVAESDLHLSMVWFMRRWKRILPQIHGGYEVEIHGGRHPVVEAFLPENEQFVPNDLLLKPDRFFQIITGPNMGGKSTYMRQQSLIILLAHAGLPVPAEKAFIPLVDGIFARIGSGDMLAKQQSTFMTEMVETATILHHATDRSFIIIDELGRGTGTRDGVALAKAISVYICQQIKAKTLFATHYHQLIDLEGVLDGAENVHVGVYESDHDIVFLKKIMPGGTQKSYGIDVAKYAGIPRGIIVLATQYCDEGVLSQEYTKKNLPSPQQSSLFQSSPKDLFVEQLRTSYAGLEVNKITPLEAMMILEKIVSSIRESANL